MPRRRLAEAERTKTLPIFVGGTGLYFKALTRGLSKVPPVPADIRRAVRERLAAEGPQALHAELALRDPPVAARLNPADRVRIARALEVMIATGRSIDEWNRDNSQPLIDPARAVKMFLAPERKELYARIDARFDAMLAAGALDEVRALAQRQLDPLLPAMKAHGVPWLIKHLAGEMTLDGSRPNTRKLDTRHYAKRQFTWFRHQLADWTRVAPEARARDRLGRARALRPQPPQPGGHDNRQRDREHVPRRPDHVAEIEIGQEHALAHRRRCGNGTSRFR